MPKLFYGWWIVIASFINLFLGNGVALYSFGAFFKPLIMEFGWTRTSVSMAYSFLSIAAGLASPILGKVLDHYGPRRVMVPGAIALGLSYMWLFKLHTIWQLWAVYIVIGVGFVSTTAIPCTKVISQWFIKKRGRAFGIALSGVGMGGPNHIPFGKPPNFFIGLEGRLSMLWDYNFGGYYSHDCLFD